MSTGIDTSGLSEALGGVYTLLKSGGVIVGVAADEWDDAVEPFGLIKYSLLRPLPRAMSSATIFDGISSRNISRSQRTLGGFLSQVSSTKAVWVSEPRPPLTLIEVKLRMALGSMTRSISVSCRA